MRRRRSISATCSYSRECLPTNSSPLIAKTQWIGWEGAISWWRTCTKESPLTGNSINHNPGTWSQGTQTSNQKHQNISRRFKKWRNKQSISKSNTTACNKNMRRPCWRSKNQNTAIYNLLPNPQTMRKKMLLKQNTKNRSEIKYKRDYVWRN